MKTKHEQSATTTIICPNCDGTTIDEETGKKCMDCNGTGKVKMVSSTQSLIPRRR